MDLSALKKINAYLSLLKENGFSFSSVEKKQYNYEAEIKRRGESVKLLVYFGKKGIKTVLQGNKELKLFGEVNDLIFGDRLFDTSTLEINEPQKYIGTDESGKGDFFGPLVIAGVFADENILVQLKELGVKDSKELSDNGVNYLAPKIRKILYDKYDMIVIFPEKYNELYLSFKNVNRILGWAHARVLENILKKYFAGVAISDKFGDEKLINSSLQELGAQVELYQFTKAERYTAVAAASILARNQVNLWFEKISKQMKIKIPKGASNEVEKTAKELRTKLGEDMMKKYIKLHFKTTKKIVE